MVVESGMNTFAELDAISLSMLQAGRGTKWISGGDSIGAFIAEMDFGIAPVITEALHASVRKGEFGYHPGDAIAELSSVTADWLSRNYHWQVAPADIRPMPDVIRALEFAIEHLIRPESKIIVPTPAYSPFIIVPPMLGREVIEVPMNHTDGLYKMDLAGLQRAFNKGGELLILCNPHNPSGRVFNRDELLALEKLVEHNGGHVFADEIWAPMTFPGHQHIPYASISDSAAARSITAISASKAWNLPGLKCAQVITTSDRDRSQWAKFGPLAEHGTANLGIVASIAAYRDGEPWRASIMAYLDRNRRSLDELISIHLPQVRYREPEGTYVGWLDFRRTAAAANPASYLEKRANVKLSEGVECGASGAGFVRLIIATPHPILELAITRMSGALDI